MKKILCLSLLLFANSSSYATEQVPFGDVVSQSIFNYHRHTQSIATSGTLKEGAIEELKNHGFKTIIDMRTEGEGTKDEAALARKHSLTYVNIPVSSAWPTKADFQQFKIIIEDKKNHPVLIHCASANRVGMFWAAYQIQQGKDKQIAIEEGRAIGMKPSREAQLIQHLK
ncbi:fused DSP-PTPase phosphatase/NAD kinase-like protein [Algicola sagamiensis]|uniref:fused DSP-PTPase phosphatase/NAD kinase-like protein n=1 Tax=Algicola sagamiensis TaxID=163869 RepID=UPI00036B0D30|nr:protein tyrosine phosphatase family protein [Algicola sagamiensis]